MLIDFTNAIDEHIDLIQKYQSKNYQQHHLVSNPFQFWINDDEIKIQDIITLHHNGVKFQYLMAYIMIPEANKGKTIPSSLSYPAFINEDGSERPLTWSDLIERTSNDNLYHLAYTNNNYKQTTVEDLIELDATPDVELWSVAEFQYKTYNSNWKTFEADESTDFFTISKINSDWKKYFDDYTVARDRMKEVMVAKGGFTLLPLEEQKIVSRWKCVPTTDIISVLNQYEMAASESIFQKNSTEANKRRIQLCQYLLKNAIAPAELPNIIKDINSYNLIESFCERLVRGTSSLNHDGIADNDGILDYINSTSSFSTTGFKTQNTVMINGYTKEQLCVMLTNMINKGTWQ